jgi:hypothetical protein
LKIKDIAVATFVGFLIFVLFSSRLFLENVIQSRALMNFGIIPG